MEAAAQSKVNLVSSNPFDHSSSSSSSEGEVSGVSDAEEVAVAHSKGDFFQVDNTNRNDSKTDGMEKLIYLHIARMGDSIVKEPETGEAGFRDATNEWYVIKRGSDGGVVLLPVFQDIKPLNYPNTALRHTTCQVIGSCIYVIGGCSVVGEVLCGTHVDDPGSSKIRCLDTRNPSNGWRTCAALPFNVCGSRSTVVNDQQLYFFGGDRINEFYFQPQEPWGYALNLYHDSKKGKQGTEIAQPGCSTFFPVVSTLSPSSLVAYMEEESTFYQLDCTNNTWTVYQKDLPYKLARHHGGSAIYDGILYICDTVDMRLTSYDIHNKKELDVVDLPRSFWFGCTDFVNLIVLAKNKFCIIWDGCGEDVNYIYIYYTRFSVSHLHPKPTVVLEERQYFHISGYEILNVVAVDSQQDAATNSLSCSTRVCN